MQHNVKIVGLAGKAGFGKSTIAKMIYELVPRTRVTAFAAPLKDMVRTIFPDLTDYHLKDPVGKAAKTEILNGHSPRELMQFFGTDFVREFDPNLWVKRAKQQIDKERAIPQHSRTQKLNVLVFDDVRFPNEVELIRKYDGCIIHLERSVSGGLVNQFKNFLSMKSSTKNHSSESGVRHMFDQNHDFILNTDESLNQTRYDVEYIVEHQFLPDYQL